MELNKAFSKEEIPTGKTFYFFFLLIFFCFSSLGCPGTFL